MLNYLRPLKLSSNRVWRTYKGGKLLEDWQGVKNISTDGDFPEEWVASVTRARNVIKHGQNEGLSYIKFGDSRIFLSDLINSAPDVFLGKEHVEKYGCNLGILVKLIDSAERLTIQVHPDSKIAKELFHSQFGKTEAWYILGGRNIGQELPYIILGFKPGMNKEKWKQLFYKQEINAMLGSLHKFYIKPGQVFLLEGGVPHAIGPGCFLVEIQEPTDYTIRVERTTPSGKKIPDMLCHQGIGFNNIFECFNYQSFSRQETLKRWLLKPTVNYQSDFAYEEILIDGKRIPYFGMKSLLIYNSFSIRSENIFSIIIVISGNGKVICENKSMVINKGDKIFLPAGLGKLNFKNICSVQPLHLISCFPPDSTKKEDNYK